MWIICTDKVCLRKSIKMQKHNEDKLHHITAFLTKHFVMKKYHSGIKLHKQNKSQKKKMMFTEILDTQ